MLLRIQPDESLRSYVERNLFLQLHNPAFEIFKTPEFRYTLWRSKQVLSIASIFGWNGCYGFNKLVHLHTDYPFRGVLKSKDSCSYSESEFVSESYYFDDLREKRSYCPLCVKEDTHVRGYSYWRRIHSRITVCAKHNVNLLSHCQFCEKPFSRDGHAVHVMWSGCAGRSLGEAEPTVNTDPVALRLAQFYERLCSLQHHLSAETVLRVLEENLTEVIDNETSETDFREKLAKLTLSTDGQGGHQDFRLLVHRERLHVLIELVAIGYESFEMFLSDCFRHEPGPAPIDSYWSSYRIAGHASEQYIEENYRLGVGIWSCHDPDDYMASPFHSSVWYGRRPITYSCCNLPYPRPKGHQLKPVRVEAALPKVPRIGGAGCGQVMTSRPSQSNEPYRSSLSDDSDWPLQ